MKRIDVFRILFLVTVLSFSFHAFGHPPCQPERESRNSAHHDWRDAQSWVDCYANEVRLIWIDYVFADSEVERMQLRVQLILAQISLREAEVKAERLREKLDRAQTALNVCLAFAYRRCGCPVHDTQSLTSCHCSYNTWNNWCHCPY